VCVCVLCKCIVIRVDRRKSFVRARGSRKTRTRVWVCVCVCLSLCSTYVVAAAAAAAVVVGEYACYCVDVHQSLRCDGRHRVPSRRADKANANSILLASHCFFFSSATPRASSAAVGKTRVVGLLSETRRQRIS